MKNRKFGRFIRRARKNKGLGSRDSSYGLGDYLIATFIPLIKRKMDYGSIARKVVQVEEMPEGVYPYLYAKG